MFFGSSTPANTSEETPTTHIGNWGTFFVYKTNATLEQVKAINGNENRDITELTDLAKLMSELDTSIGLSNSAAHKIRRKYSVDREFQALRTNDPEYRAFVEQTLADHKAAKDALFAV
jgi:PHP family Zn ribbon phosphoesterase